MTNAPEPQKARTALALLNSMVLSGAAHSETSHEALDAALDEISRFTAALSPTPVVKPLEWYINDDHWRADTILGHYTVGDAGKGLGWLDCPGTPLLKEPWDDCKGLAQIHYERHILSVLETQPYWCIAELEAERDRLRVALIDLLDLESNTSPFGGEVQADRIERTIENARAALKLETQ